MRQDSQNCETRRKNETKKSKMRQDSQNCENQPPEPLPDKPSEVPHTIHTSSDLKDTTEEANCCVLEKFEENLKLYQIYLKIFDQKSQLLVPNPKMVTIQQLLEGMPEEKAEGAIKAFLGWLCTSKNVRCKYAAFASALRDNWELQS